MLTLVLGPPDPNMYAGHLLMFPSGWGCTICSAATACRWTATLPRRAASSTIGTILEVLAQGDRVRLVVNGKLSVDWGDPEPKRILEGPIGLQLHSNNNLAQGIHFKDLV